MQAWLSERRAWPLAPSWSRSRSSWGTRPSRRSRRPSETVASLPAESDTPPPATDVLVREAVRLAQHAVDKWDALRQSGALLEELGAVDVGYAAAILEREGQISTYMGEGVAIPHGTD